MGRTCCELPAGETPTFGVTYPEAIRASKASGVPVSKCFTVESLTKEEYADFIKKSEVFSKIFTKGLRVRLNVIPDGPGNSCCVFLKKGEGCSLPKDSRPHVCRLYPFWFEASVSKGGNALGITIVNNLFSGPCYGKLLAKSGELLSLFNTDIDSLKSVASQLLVDAEAHAVMVKSKLRR